MVTLSTEYGHLKTRSLNPLVEIRTTSSLSTIFLRYSNSTWRAGTRFFLRTRSVLTLPLLTYLGRRRLSRSVFFSCGVNTSSPSVLCQWVLTEERSRTVVIENVIWKKNLLHRVHFETRNTGFCGLICESFRLNVCRTTHSRSTGFSADNL